ncbi:OmpA family protein [Flavobacterium azooxidireducens]|uniref:OmpA family protein n=1 Tax=Flavobacterium azooxidireducens TaxID=1871076 RepID=A0ABY4KHT8_9FLAO|nr:OmpA family protein [Flavobacterium azooxidireducens]UPQ80391.1 OmpA family protein [Flavobacterium azooxidireducens]UPQ80727.1 OmpA family protein [Flavobacterium azooxidireducens]
MKKIYISILSIVSLSLTPLSAQNKDTQKADKLFKRLEYVDAAQEYLKLTEKGKADGYVYKQLADSYFNTFNASEATTWYARAVETPQDAETYHRYAQMLKAQGKYEEANKQMQTFASKAPNDQRAKDFKANPNYLPSLLDKQKKFDIKPLDINSDKSDFGAVLHQNNLYFTSARNGARKTYGWNEEPFLDIYKATYNVDGTITNAETVTDLNSKWHDGPSSLSADGNTIYFSSESFKEKGGFEKDKSINAKLGQVNLYKATMANGKWSNITQLPFNSNTYSTGNPALSKDGKTLYFASNRPGSIGGTDIWKVAVNADGSYGEPENLGSKVNTEGEENFPFVTEDNKTLYFASNGRQGFGGLDVFAYDMTKGESTNLGKPVNSEKDDFAFSLNAEKNIGFLSTNRSGVDNIYLATPVCGVEVITLVSDAKTGKALANAKVAIVDEKKNVIATETTGANGEVAYYVECNKTYTIQATKDGYESNTFPVAASKGESRKVEASLNPIEDIVTDKEVVLKSIFFEFNKSNITQEGAFELDKLVQVLQNNKNMVILVKAHTDNRGSDSYNLRLSDARAKSTVQYILSKGISKDQISGKGMGESEPKVDCKEACTEEQHAENRRSEFLIVKK